MNSQDTGEGKWSKGEAGAETDSSPGRLPGDSHTHAYRLPQGGAARTLRRSEKRRMQVQCHTQKESCVTKTEEKDFLKDSDRLVMVTGIEEVEEL